MNFLTKNVGRVSLLSFLYSTSQVLGWILGQTLKPYSGGADFGHPGFESHGDDDGLRWPPSDNG